MVEEADPAKRKFTEAMFEIYRRAKVEAKYPATYFLKMLNERKGVATAKALINADTQSDGFTALYLAKRLDLSVEALVVEDTRWHELFSEEERAKALRRLENNGYVPKVRTQAKSEG